MKIPFASQSSWKIVGGQNSALLIEAQMFRPVIPGRIKDANPESRDSGFALSRAPE